MWGLIMIALWGEMGHLAHKFLSRCLCSHIPLYVCVCRVCAHVCGCIYTLYLHFDVIFQLSIEEVKGNRLLKFRILWKRMSDWGERRFKNTAHKQTWTGSKRTEQGESIAKQTYSCKSKCTAWFYITIQVTFLLWQYLHFYLTFIIHYIKS